MWRSMYGSWGRGYLGAGMGYPYYGYAGYPMWGFGYPGYYGGYPYPYAPY